MNSFLVLALIVVAMSGAWARPREHHNHRSHRQADCANNYRPFTPGSVVCASDGKTYVNEEHLNFENCLNDEDVTVEREGWCDEEIQTIEALKDLVWGLATSFLEEMFDDIEPAVLEEILGLFFALSEEEASGEEILNFLKNLEPEEDIEETLGEFKTFLESLDTPTDEKPEEEEEEDSNDIPVVEEDEDNIFGNVIPEILVD